MWFCGSCRVVVEKSVLVDRKIEDRCKEIMKIYESRIAELERLVKLKSEVSQFVNISQKVNDSLTQNEFKEASCLTQTVDGVISEMYERKE